MITSICLAFTLASAGQAPPPVLCRDHWDFKFKSFVIGAWWGPGATDAEMKLYKEAGFNVVMGGRYMQLDDYGDPNKGVRELDLAQKYGLGLLFDTYTKNEHPWGQCRPGIRRDCSCRRRPRRLARATYRKLARSGGRSTASSTSPVSHRRHCRWSCHRP